MQTETNDTMWRSIEQQIKELTIDKQIENLRSRLAEDWHCRRTQGEADAAADRN